MSTTFYDNFGIQVTDTVFKTPKGDQYPIRNISSVKVRSLPVWIALIFAALAFIQGVSQFSSQPEQTVKQLVLTVIILLLYWYVLPARTLLIGTGGSPQPAIRLTQRHAKKFLVLEEVSDALNSAIANLQKT